MSAVLEQERPESKLSSKSSESQLQVDEDDEFKAQMNKPLFEPDEESE